MLFLEASAAVEKVYAADWGRIVATLIRSFGDFDLAEESAQEAFAAAVVQWGESGVPASLPAWIIQTARHKAIDRIRRQTAANLHLLPPSACARRAGCVDTAHALRPPDG